MRYYEDFTVGRVWDYEARYEVTEMELLEIGRRWDPQPFHTDPAAAEASLFGGLVASSVHLFAIATRLGASLPADQRTAAVSALGFRTLQLHAPARPGDVLRMRTTVLERRLSNSRPGVGVVTTRSELWNQSDDLVYDHENSFLVHCRPAD